MHAYPQGRRQVWFDRDAARADDGGDEFAFPGVGFRGRSADLTVFTRPNALFLSVGATLNDLQLSAIHRWFNDNFWLVTPGADVTSRAEWTHRLLTDAKEAAKYAADIVGLLSIADLGVTGADIDPESGEVRLRHRTKAGDDVALDFFREESLGTHAWFAFLGPLVTVLETGSVLLVDELDSSLHPTLAAEVVRLFQDVDANPKGAQLIFTTHDATLLGSPVLDRPLDRDQIWLTSKQRSGETELYPLIDAKPRPDENLERGYLRGRYGGIPRISAGKIPRERSRQLVEKGSA